MPRIVLHVDMDAFFAAIEERDHPEFKGFPIIVGADPKEGHGRGVVSTANYEARKYGVHSAQPISQAWKSCKAGETAGGKKCIFFEGNFSKYEKESEKIMRIIQKYARLFEQVSVDEAFLELSRQPYSISYKEAKRIATGIKDQIRKEIQLTCSIGIGPNKLVAKIASDFKKPDGITVVTPQEAQKFLDPMHVHSLPGIGPKAETILASHRIKTIQNLRKASEENLEQLLGAWGEKVYYMARGLDDRPVGEATKTKSIGREHTFEKDTLDPEELLATLKTLAARVTADARIESANFKTIELKVRLHDFSTMTRSKTLSTQEDSAGTIEHVGMALLLPFLDHRENPGRKKIRLLGVRVSKLIQ